MHKEKFGQGIMMGQEGVFTEVPREAQMSERVGLREQQKWWLERKEKDSFTVLEGNEAAGRGLSPHVIWVVNVLGKRDTSKFYTGSHVISLVKQNSSLIRFECFVCFMNSLKLAPKGSPQLTGWPLRLLTLVFSSIFRSLRYLLIIYWWDLYTHRLQTQWCSEMIREWPKDPCFTSHLLSTIWYLETVLST